jgi:hypothetical protein
MANIPNKLVIFGAIAAAALAVPGLVGPLMFDEAYATHNEQSNNANQRADDNVLNVQAIVQANADVRDVTVCVIADDCR